MRIIDRIIGFFAPRSEFDRVTRFLNKETKRLEKKHGVPDVIRECREREAQLKQMFQDQADARRAEKR